MWLLMPLSNTMNPGLLAPLPPAWCTTSPSRIIFGRHSVLRAGISDLEAGRVKVPARPYDPHNAPMGASESLLGSPSNRPPLLELWPPTTLFPLPLEYRCTMLPGL